MCIKIKSAFLVLLILLLLAGCGGGTVLDLTGVSDAPERFVWGSGMLTPSVSDIGLFYVNGENLRFYDMEAGRSFVLCGRANCTHGSDSCPAYFPQTMFSRSAESLAQIGPYLYCTYYSGASNAGELTDPKSGSAIQLLRIDPSDGSRKVLASFPSGYNAAGEEDAFFASSIDVVQYCGGYAWFSLNMRQQNTEERKGASFIQLCGVNLETGEVVTLNSCDGYDYSFSAITPDAVYYTRTRDTVPLMSNDAFYAQAGTGGTVAVEGNTFEDYSSYWIWHCNHYSDEYEVLAYTAGTGQTRTLFSGLTVPATDTGDWVMQYAVYAVRGSFDGKVLCAQLLCDSAGNYNIYHVGYFLLDTETSERRNVLELENGDLLAVAQGYQGNMVFPDGRVFYANMSNAGKADIYVLDLNTGVSTFLFTDDPAITFRLFAAYNGGFLGKLKEHQDDMSFYWISEEDFYAGNLDAAIRYQL